MRKFSMILNLTALLATPAAAQGAADRRTPNDIVTAAPAAEWVRIAPADLVVMELAPAGTKPRRVVIQLIPPPFSQGWVENIRRLVAARWYDGIAVVRVQDNYVVQWGDPDAEVPGKAKALPAGLAVTSERDYQAVLGDLGRQLAAARAAEAAVGKADVRDKPDSYAQNVDWLFGWPIGVEADERAWPIHCYGMVGVGRNVSPDAGTGAELYAVIGHAPRQLDRNIALVGRVIAGIEHLSSLPRGTGELGFYERPEERPPIVSVRMGGEVPDLPDYEYLSTESASFAAYAHKRANRQDDFYIRPAGGVDACNVPVPIRESAAAQTRRIR